MLTKAIIQTPLRSIALAGLLAAGAAMTAAVPAQAAGSDVTRTGFGTIKTITAGMRSPANCARITGKKNGAPGGVATARNAHPITIVVALSGGQCGKSSIRYTFNANIPRHKELIQLYFVSTGGKLLKNEKIAAY